MQVQAVKLDQGWFIKDLPGFEEIKTDVIDIDVDLTPNQFHSLDYKELRCIVIMERYFEKRQRESQESKNITDLQATFRKKFDVSSSPFAVALREL
jgi:hypothetical protein